LSSVAAIADGCYAIRFVLPLDGKTIRWHFFRNASTRKKVPANVRQALSKSAGEHEFCAVTSPARAGIVNPEVLKNYYQEHTQWIAEGLYD
jgi:hypothetical protein